MRSDQRRISASGSAPAFGSSSLARASSCVSDSGCARNRRAAAQRRNGGCTWRSARTGPGSASESRPDAANQSIVPDAQLPPGGGEEPERRTAHRGSIFRARGLTAQVTTVRRFSRITGRNQRSHSGVGNAASDTVRRSQITIWSRAGTVASTPALGRLLPWPAHQAPPRRDRCWRVTALPAVTNHISSSPAHLPGSPNAGVGTTSPGRIRLPVVAR